MFLNMGIEPPHDRGCRICGKIGHIAKNCTQHKTCNLCKQTGHYVKDCPQKMKQRGKLKSVEHSVQEFLATNEGDVKNIRGQPVKAQTVDLLRKNVIPSDLYPRFSDDRNSSRKLVQMGYPTHRHPPPGFNQNYNSPPPGFKQKFPMYPNGTSFSSRNHPLPPHHLFPRSKPLDVLSQSPPKQYSLSPPNNFFSRSNMHRKLSDPVSPMGIHSGLLPDPYVPPGDRRGWQNRQQMPHNSYSPQNRGKPDW